MKKRNRRIVFAVTVLYWFAQYIYMPYQTPYLLAIGCTASLAGSIVGAYGMTQLAMRLPIGIEADRVGRHKRFIVIGAFLAGGASLLRYFLPSAVGLAAANLISGISASMWISFTVFYVGLFAPEEGKRAMGHISAANQAGILLGFAAGTLLAQVWTVEGMFFVSAAAGLASGALACAISEPKMEKREKASPRSLLRESISPRLTGYALVSMVAQAVNMGTAMSFTSQVAQGLGASDAQIGILSMVYMAASIGGAALIGTRFLRRANERFLTAILLVMQAGYCALVPACTSWEMLIAVQLLGGAAFAAIMTLAMALATEGTEGKSTAMGYLQAIYGVGIMIGPIIMGALVGMMDFWGSYLVMGAAALLTAAIAAVVGLRRRAAEQAK